VGLDWTTAAAYYRPPPTLDAVYAACAAAKLRPRPVNVIVCTDAVYQAFKAACVPAGPFGPVTSIPVHVRATADEARHLADQLEREGFRVALYAEESADTPTVIEG
jgi:hypothetical protein